MLRKPSPHQAALEIVTLEELVPADHLLRKIAASVDFRFIRDRVEHLYCADNGRPALDPEILFKILLIGYLFGVRSERQLMREIAVNVAYRWFLDLRLTDAVPDASTLSQNRRRRFADSPIYQEIFDEIVVQAIGHGLVDGTVLYTDSTHLKANANKTKYDLALVAKSRADYLDALDRAIEADRAAHGKARPSRMSRRSRRRRSAGRIRTPATWCATASRRASSISIIGRWTDGMPSSPTATSRRPTCMTASPISAVSTDSGAVSTSPSVPSGWMRATPPPGSPRGWRIATSWR
jgi:transposase